MICLGLYRFRDSHANHVGVPSAKRFVICSPPYTFKLQQTDLVFVLAHSDPQLEKFKLWKTRQENSECCHYGLAWFLCHANNRPWAPDQTGKKPWKSNRFYVCYFYCYHYLFLIKISPFLCVSLMFLKLLVMMANMHESISHSYLAKLERLLKPPLFFVV